MLKGNLEADYFLFINGKAVGVLEAKREDIDALSDKVCDQAVLYAKSVPPVYQTYQKPLPFIFTSNGKELYFCDFREQEQSFRQIMSIPTPYELVKRLGIIDWFAGLPTLQKKGLRDCQYEAVTELEKSFRSGQNRALMVLATGAGKTYTACLAAYRLLSYTPMQRILFLVDRNNLGKQAEGEFGTFRLTENGDAFNTIFTVTRLKSANIPSDSNVVISTIQRLFSLLKGEEIADDDKADDEPDIEEDVVLPSNPNLPHDFFDLIIIDECHRSIYKSWKQVLEYFDTARLIGLTATPIPETKAFFNYNISNQRARRLSVARKTNSRHAFDLFVRKTARNIFNTALFLLIFKLLGLVAVPWHGVVAYPLLWWVCLFVIIVSVAVYVGTKERKQK